MAETRELLEFALAASRAAEEVILNYYGRGVNVEWKPDNTPVTIADKSAEEIVRNLLMREMPEAGFIGEEGGIENENAEYQWIMDPIDGTKSFIHGVPLFGTLLALYRKGIPLVGLIRLPALKSCLWASLGGGAFLDGEKITCSSVSSLQEALVLSGTLNTMEDKGRGEAFTKLRRSARLYRGWGDCYGYYLVATGKAEVMVDPVVSLWDIAPLPLIMKEAGGVFSTLDGKTELFDAVGKPTGSIYEGFTGIAANGALYERALSFFSKA
ncbi:MAG: histidinol-phosphatase [Fibrobacter sp.]|jgi:histidinol phosphatase-like enzyme (inositol monophosphatase family)|nr:histidinol-phosphatase [Fibrobacter sp.]